MTWLLVALAATTTGFAALLIVGRLLHNRHCPEHNPTQQPPPAYTITVTEIAPSNGWCWIYRRDTHSVAIDGYNNREEALSAALIYAECIHIGEAG